MLDAGNVVAGYRIDRILGQGGMGVVYEATQLSLRRTVALKFLSSHFLQDADFRERFQREGVIQAGIDHQHIVPVYEAGEVEQGLFLAMRFVRGPNLKELIVGGELDAGRGLAILAQIADALDVAHEAGLTHRDIKPQNILVGARDHGYLADFGLTKGPDVVSLTRTGQFLGTLDYVAPEQINGQDATALSDIYSLAAVLHECLTGVVPFKRASEAALLFAHVTDPPPAVTDRRPDLPPAIDAVIARGMAKRPQDRPATACALIEDAVRALGPRGATAAAPAVVNGGASRAPSTRPKPGTTLRSGEALPARDSTAVESWEPTRAETAAVEVTAAAAATAPETAAVETTVAAAATAPETAAVEATAAATTAPVEAAPIAPAQAITLASESADAITSPLAPRSRRTKVDLRPPRPPTPPAAATGSRRRPLLLTGGLALAVVAAVAGVLAAGQGSPGTKDAVASAPVSAGALRLTVPATWRHADPGATPGLQFRDPQALAAPGGGRVIAGAVDSGDPTLLGAGLRGRLPGTPDRDAVKLGALAAYRYAGLRPKGWTRRADLYTVPTTAGVATVACVAPPAASAAFWADCAHIAGSLRLAGATAYPLGPDAGYGRRLDAVVRALGTARSRLRAGLRRAKRPAEQATYARRLAAAFADAATGAGAGAASPAVLDARARIVSALDATAGAYRDLAAASRRRDRAAYARARTAVARAEAGVDAALAKLTAEGYQVG